MLPPPPPTNRADPALPRRARAGSRSLVTRAIDLSRSSASTTTGTVLAIPIRGASHKHSSQHPCSPGSRARTSGVAPMQILGGQRRVRTRPPLARPASPRSRSTGTIPRTMHLFLWSEYVRRQWARPSLHILGTLQGSAVCVARTQAWARLGCQLEPAPTGRWCQTQSRIRNARDRATQSMALQAPNAVRDLRKQNCRHTGAHLKQKLQHRDCRHFACERYAVLTAARPPNIRKHGPRLTTPLGRAALRLNATASALCTTGLRAPLITRATPCREMHVPRTCNAACSLQQAARSARGPPTTPPNGPHAGRLMENGEGAPAPRPRSHRSSSSQRQARGQWEAPAWPNQRRHKPQELTQARETTATDCQSLCVPWYARGRHTIKHCNPGARRRHD